jgi:hypothetical protein
MNRRTVPGTSIIEIVLPWIIVPVLILISIITHVRTKRRTVPVLYYKASSKLNAETTLTINRQVQYFCNEVRVNGWTTKDGTQSNPFLVPEPQGMKSHQLCLDVGGA